MKRLPRVCSFVRVLAMLLLLPVSLQAQTAGQDSPAQPANRTVGIPGGIDWTFNFDAGWGTFGFGNSLFDNPKEPVPENLSDQWFEGYVKPAVSGRYRLPSSSEIYGKVSVVGERTYGSAPELYGPDVSSFAPEDAAIGWRSGKSIGASENLLDVTVGRAQYRLGHAFLLWDGAAEGGSRGGYWTNARKAFEFAAIGRVHPGPHLGEVFYLDKDELDEADTGTRLFGGNYEYSYGDHTTIGVTYLRLSAHEELRPGRAGLNVFDVRTFTAPVRTLPNLSFEFEYASERNGDTLDANAWEMLGVEAEAVLSLCLLPRRRSRYHGQRIIRPVAPRLLRLGHLVAGRDRRRLFPVELQPRDAPGARAPAAPGESQWRRDLLELSSRSAGRRGCNRQRRRGGARSVCRLEVEQQLHDQHHWSARQSRGSGGAGERPHRRVSIRAGVRRLQLLTLAHQRR
jgi:hypothetical protein